MRYAAQFHECFHDLIGNDWREEGSRQARNSQHGSECGVNIPIDSSRVTLESRPGRGPGSMSLQDIGTRLRWKRKCGGLGSHGDVV
jgi:hypothetical protein